MKQRAPKRNKAPAPAKQPVQKKKKPARQPKGLPRWRLILLSLALLGFVVFLCPVFGGILNPVNGAAMLGFLALAAVFLFWPGFVGLLKRIWRRPWSRILLLLSGLGLLILSQLLCRARPRRHREHRILQERLPERGLRRKSPAGCTQANHAGRPCRSPLDLGSMLAIRERPLRFTLQRKRRQTVRRKNLHVL